MFCDVPLAFEENRGQIESDAKFIARGKGYAISLTSNRAVVVLVGTDGTTGGESNDSRLVKFAAGRALLEIQAVGTNPNPRVRGIDELPRKSNYLIGNDPNRWRREIPNYLKVRYENVYPGIDMEYYFSHNSLEYDFIVSPGSDPRSIVVGYKGVDDMRIGGNGDLLLSVAGLAVQQGRPVVYQEKDGGRNEIKAAYVPKGIDSIGVTLGKYDLGRSLIIDPVLSYSSYVGGDLYDSPLGIAVDSKGGVYVTGVTNSSNFPTTSGGFQTAFHGPGADYDVFVMKWNPTGTDLVYSTYFGGTGTDWGYGIAVDSEGNAYLAGGTQSADLPTTPGAFQTRFHDDFGDGFVAKLNATGSDLIYSTYLGGGDPQRMSHDIAYGIALDQAGNAFVVGETQSNDFPTTRGALQGSKRGITDAFITKLNSTGTGLIYSTYLGGSDEDFAQKVAVDSSGNAYITGLTASDDFPATAGVFQSLRKGLGDIFVTKMNPDGSGLIYATYLGGRAIDRPADIAVDSAGSVYVTGWTQSTDFPTTPGSLQSSFPAGTCVYPCTYTYAFVTKFNPACSALVYSTFIGGSGGWGAGLVIDDLGSAYITGGMEDALPVTASAFQQSQAGSGDAFVAKLNSSGSALLYSTYLGGDLSDFGTCIAVDKAGNIYLGGETYSANFPVSANAFQSTLSGGHLDVDAFIARLKNVPGIMGVSVSGKRLVVSGEDFSGGAVILLNGSAQRTANDDQNPTTTLIAPRAGKRIASGGTVAIQVQNADGTLSNKVEFTRP
jgi:hypothetical protein